MPFIRLLPWNNAIQRKMKGKSQKEVSPKKVPQSVIPGKASMRMGLAGQAWVDDKCI
jgi:hypothetical protein